MSDSILQTAITWAMVEEDIQKAYNTTAKLGANKKEIDLGNPHGYISRCALLEFDWDKDANILPKNGLIKITIAEHIENMSRAIKAYDNALEQAAEFNNTELRFYSAQQELPVKCPLPVPKLIAGRKFGVNGIHAGFCIFEKLEGFFNVHVYENLDDGAVKETIELLADLAAYSFNYPEYAEKIAGSGVFDVHFGDFINATKVIHNLNAIATRFKEAKDSIEIIKKIAPIFSTIDNLRNTMIATTNNIAIVHGDIWPGNILWKKNEEDETSILAVVDFQVTHLGNPCEDLVRFLSKSLSSVGHAQKRSLFLRIYYDRFLSKLKNATDSPWKSFKELNDDYERVFPIIFCIWLPPFVQLITDDKILNAKNDGQGGARIENFRTKLLGMVDEAVNCIKKHHATFL